MTRICFLLQVSLYLFVLSLFFGRVQARNRTFSLVTINPDNAALNGKTVVRASNLNPSGVGVGFATPAPLTVFIYNQNLFTKCSSSPTGNCIGYFQKNYGGALRGWNFQFWINENFPTSNPIGSYAGRFAVQKIGEMDLLVEGVDATTGSGGSSTYQLCEYLGAAPGSGYALTPAVTGAICIWGTKFRVLYTDANTCPY